MIIQQIVSSKYWLIDKSAPSTTWSNLAQFEERTLSVSSPTRVNLTQFEEKHQLPAQLGLILLSLTLLCSSTTRVLRKNIISIQHY